MTINRDVLGPFSHRYVSSSSEFRFPFLLKILSFFHRPQNLSEKNDNFELIYCWIVVKFKHQVCNSIWSLSTIGNYENMSELGEIPFHCNFSFLAEILSCLDKITILNSLTVRLSWNLDMWFVIHFLMSSPLGFAKYYMRREKDASHVGPWNEGFDSFSFSLTFGNPNRATGGGALENTRNITIDNGERLSDYIEVRDKLFTIRD